MTNQALRVGRWSALGMVAVGVLYATILIFGIAITGFDHPISGPVLNAMEALTLLSAPLIVLLFSAIHMCASHEDKAFSLAAFGFAVIAAGLTAAVHFVSLSALRQLGRQGIQWPSELYATELLAWDVFLGFALLASVPIFQADKTLQRVALATGTLCLAGAAGPLLGLMRLQFISVLGYGALLPVTSFLLARHFQPSKGPP